MASPFRPTSPSRRRDATPATPGWLGRAGLGLAAAVITGGVIGLGVLDRSPAEDVTADAGSLVDLQSMPVAREAEREAVVSRSDRREAADPAKAARLAPGPPEAETRTESLEGADPRTLARALMGDFGFSASQFGCLDSLWQKESGWDPAARNPSSGAHGIPQALPGSKMASVGADWATNPRTQITWGLGYIQDRYGSPCAAWAHSQRVNWY